MKFERQLQELVAQFGEKKVLEALDPLVTQRKRTINGGIRVQINHVWKRKEDGLLVRVSGLIFLKPNRVIWRALPNQGTRSADGVTTETEFKKQYEHHPDLT